MRTEQWFQIGAAVAAFLLIRKLFGGPSPIPNDTGEKPTLNGSDFKRMADTIYGLLWVQGGPLWEDEAGVSQVVLLCSNDADLIALWNAYGSRAPWWGTSMDLGTSIRTMFSNGQLDSLNSRLSAKGINYRF